MGLIVAVMVVFTVALIPTKNNPEPIRRGLDLKGGTHLVMRVNVGDATRLEVDQAMEMLKTQATKNNLPVPTTRRTTDSSFVAVPPAGVSTAEYERIAKDYLGMFDTSRAADGSLVFKMKGPAVLQLSRDTINQAVETIDNRVNALGVTEPIIAPQGDDRIVIQLPGVDDPARVKDIIKTTAQLQFRMVEGNSRSGREERRGLDSGEPEERGRHPPRHPRGPARPRHRHGVLPGPQDRSGQRPRSQDRAFQKGRLGEPVIGFSLTPDGAPKFGALTGANVGRRLAIVLDNRVVSAPNDQQPDHRSGCHRRQLHDAAGQRSRADSPQRLAAGLADHARRAHGRAVARARLDPRA